MTDLHDHGSIREDSAGPSGSAALRIAVVAASHPAAPAAAHATSLAHHLADSGHEVSLLTWGAVRPAVVAAEGAPARPAGARPPRQPGGLVDRARDGLRWARPDTWLRAGSRLRGVDVILLVPVLPALVPAHTALLRSAGALQGGGPLGGPGRRPHTGRGGRPHAVAVCVEDLPDDASVVTRRVLSSLLSRVDGTLVRSASQARLATGLGARRVAVAATPPPAAPEEPTGCGDRPTRLLAVGGPEDYPGLDLLLRALRSVPGVTLTVAGELGGPGVLTALAADPAMGDRLRLRGGSVPAEELQALLAAHDVLVLPDREPAAGRHLLLAETHGLPVLASDRSPASGRVEDGRNGLVLASGSEAAAAAALRRLGDQATRQRLAEGARTPDLSGPWATYLGVVEALSVDQSAVASDPPKRTPRSPATRWSGAPGAAMGRVRAAVHRSLDGASGHWADTVAMRGADVPDRVRPTDTLVDPVEAKDARRTARLLGLPRTTDALAAWAALGAIAAILRVRDDGRRGAVIVDGSHGRSLFTRWAHSVGYAPVTLPFPGPSAPEARASREAREPRGSRPDLRSAQDPVATELDVGSVDVVVRLHPDGCDAGDVDAALDQASWALRPGGLLIVTVPIGPPGALGAMGPADVRGVLARASDLGFLLVGDLDGDVTARMRDAAGRARAGEAAYGLVRLTLRRR